MAGLGSLVVSLALQHGPYVKGLEQSDKRAQQFARNQNRAFNSVKSSALSAAKGLVGAFGALQAAKSFVRITDQYTQLTGQLKLATRGQNEFNQAYQNAIRVAQSAQAPVQETAKLYARVSNATREMGANQASVSAITEATALALKVSGATAEESASAMLQLSQAFGSGVLRGEEFNAVNEAAPRVMKALADSLGVPIGQLRDMAKEGQLTADVVGNALIDSLEQLREEAKETQTIAGAFTTMKNRLFLLVGEFGRALNASEGMGNALDYVGKVAYQVVKGALQVLGSTIVHLTFGFKNMALAATGAWDAVKKAATFDFSGAKQSLDSTWQAMGENKREANKLVNELFKVDVTVKEATGSVNRLHAAQAGVTKEQKKQAEEAQKAAKAAKERYESEIQSISERADKLAFEEATLGMMPSTITEITIARKRDEKAALSAHGKSTKLIEQEIEALERLRDVQSGQEYRKQQRENAEQKRRDDEEAARRAKQQAEEAQKAAKAAKERYESEIQSISERADKLAFEEATLGMMPSTITEITIARKRDEKAALSAHGKSTKLIEQEIEALERLRDVQSGQEYRKQQRENAEQKRRDDEEAARRAKQIMDKQQADWERANESNLKASQNMLQSYSRSITDAIFRGFESGKGIIQNFKDTLINTFKTVILRPRIEAVVAGVLGTGAGTAQAGIGNIFGGPSSGGSGIDLSSIGSIYKGVTQGFDSLNVSFSQSIADVGTFLVDQGFDKLGSAIWTNSGQISQVLGAAGSALSAVNFLKEGNTMGAIATGVGYALGGPIGGALGSFVGSFFGGKDLPPRAQGFVGTTVANGQLSSASKRGFGHDHSDSIFNALKGANEFVAQTLSGISSLFGGAGNVSVDARYAGRAEGSSYKEVLGAVDGVNFAIAKYKGKFGEEDLQAYLTELTGAHLASIIQQLKLPENVKTIFKGVADPQIIQSLTGAIGLLNDSQDILVKKFGLTTDNVYQIADQLGVTGGAFAKFATDLSGTATGMMKVSEQIISVKDAVTDALTFFPAVDSLASYDAFIKQEGDAGRVGNAGLLLNQRAGIAQYFAMLEGVRGSAASSVFDLRSQDQQQAMKQSEAASLFAQFGLSIPKSAAELVSIADSIDFTTEAGLDLAVAMPSLRAAFDSIQVTVADAAEAVGDSLNVITDNTEEALARLKAMRRSANDAVFSLRSEEDQRNVLTNNAKDLFAQYGLSLPSSGQELVDLRDNLDDSTEAGKNLLSAIPDLASAFIAMNDALYEADQSVQSYTETVKAQAREINPDRFVSLADYRVAQAREARRVEIANNPELAFTSPASTEVQALKQEVQQMRNSPTASEVSIMSLLNRMAVVLENFEVNGMKVDEYNAKGGRLTIQTRAA